jgi:hypothetical protein
MDQEYYNEELNLHMLDLHALIKKIAAIDTIEGSVIAFLQAITTDLRQNCDDPDLVQDLADSLELSEKQIASAIAANTTTI